MNSRALPSINGSYSLLVTEMKKIALLLSAVLMLFSLSNVKALETSNTSADEQPTITRRCKCSLHGCQHLARTSPERKINEVAAEPPKRLSFAKAEKLPLVVEIGKTTVGSGENPAAVWKWYCGAGTKDNDDYSGSCEI